MVSGFGGLAELPAWARDLLAEAPVARLGILDDAGGPRVLPVTFAVSGEALVSAIDAKPKGGHEPARLRFLRRRPQAALTADHYADDWDELAWVQVLGRVRLLDRREDPAGMDALTGKYRQYADRAPAGPLLRLEPHRVLCWRALR